MNPGVIVTGYIAWHYGRAFSDIFSVWMNMTWFVIHFFSIPMLLRTLFSPWKRMKESTGISKGLEAFFESLVVNIMSRIVGAVIRFVIVLLGLIALSVMLIGIVAVYIAWLVMPFLLFSLFFASIVLIF